MLRNGALFKETKRRHKLDMPSFIYLIYMCLFIFLSEE